MGDRAIRMVFLIFALFLAAALFLPHPLRADAIDGDWCYTDGRRLSINGPQIVTPAGRRTTGIYDRHGFTYTLPDAEPGDGSTVSMSQLDEDTMHYQIFSGGEKSPLLEWHRCAPATS